MLGAQRQEMMVSRSSDSAFEIVVQARPYGPPLTSAERMLRAALMTAFLALLGAEAFLLWHLWGLWP